MRFNLRGWSMFGGGLLLGSLATGVLFAPPDLANQPPPWENTAWQQAATHVLGAGPAQAKVAAAVRPAAAPASASAAAPQPVAAASQPLAAASQSMTAASQPNAAASQSMAAASQPMAAAPALAAASQPLATAPQPVAAASQPLPVAQFASGAPHAAAEAKPDTVAKTDATPKPEHRRKRAVRRIETDDDTPSAAADTNTSPDASSGFATRSEQRAAPRARGEDRSTQDMGDAGIAVDSLHLPAEAPLRGSDAPSGGDAGSGDASQ